MNTFTGPVYIYLYKHVHAHTHIYRYMHADIYTLSVPSINISSPWTFLNFLLVQPQIQIISLGFYEMDKHKMVWGSFHGFKKTFENLCINCYVLIIVCVTIKGIFHLHQKYI